MHTFTRKTLKLIGVLLLALSLLGSGLNLGTASAAVSPSAACTGSGAVTCDLWATTGTITMPDGFLVDIWGYAETSGGLPSLPGPVLVVNQGDTVTVTLHNDLSVASGLFFQGQALTPDLVGAAPGGTKSYTFTASSPGTFLYQAGLLPNAQTQVAMGLHGALIVRPTTAGQAYADASTAFDNEAILVLSEIDPNLNADPTGFDLRDFHPRYFLINGQAYPSGSGISTATPGAGGARMLLRFINAGLQSHSMSMLGFSQKVIAFDGSPLTHAYSIVAETIAPGQTQDVLFTIPASADGKRFPIFDANLNLRNANANGLGGMVTTLDVGIASLPGSDTVGPTASSASVAPDAVTGSVDVAIAATFSDVLNGNSNIQGAEYYIDSTSGTPTGMDPVDVFDSATESAAATIPGATIFGLTTGVHTVYFRAQDGSGNWGAFISRPIKVDNAGPSTTGLKINPVTSNGAKNVVLTGTGNDSASGNHNIAAAEYFIDPAGTPADGAGTAMTVNLAVPIASLTATIPAADIAALADGMHTVLVHSQDSVGNWGLFTSTSLKVDKTGPDASSLAASPDPTNGQIGFNINNPSVRFSATFGDSLSAVRAAEGFIDTVGADGKGFPFVARDGLFNTANENGYANIPLTTVAQLTNGNHTLYVHGKDAAGNWGSISSVNIFVDKTKPTVVTFNASPSPVLFPGDVTLTGTAFDALTGVTAAEWFIGTDPGAGKATPLTISGAGPTYNLDGTIDVRSWLNGTYTIFVRAKDGAGNWSVRGKTTLVVNMGQVFFSTLGNTTVPGVAGAADDADIYHWNGNNYTRLLDMSTLGLPNNANVDGLARIDNTHFYLSFSGTNTVIPGLGAVQDEDIVYYNNGAWSVFFDGTARGLTNDNLDLDAIDIVGGTIYFSTLGNSTVPGVGGSADDADIYAWNGTSFSRVWDASANGLPSGANVDGFVRVDANHFYVSFSGTTTALPGLGVVQDEDVVYYDNGTWIVYFDGTAHGLDASGNLDIDAFDIP